jgi:hypothetical protein
MEVRGFSWVSNDKVLAGVFKVGQKLRQIFIADPTKENANEVATKGDVHILNVKRILKKVVTKDSKERFTIKALIFGVLFSKSAKTLGVDTKQGDISDYKSKLKALRAELKTFT